MVWCLDRGAQLSTHLQRGENWKLRKSVSGVRRSIGTSVTRIGLNVIVALSNYSVVQCTHYCLHMFQLTTWRSQPSRRFGRKTGWFSLHLIVIFQRIIITHPLGTENSWKLMCLEVRQNSDIACRISLRLTQTFDYMPELKYIAIRSVKFHDRGIWIMPRFSSIFTLWWWYYLSHFGPNSSKCARNLPNS